jgi:hypothetical protein
VKKSAKKKAAAVRIRRPRRYKKKGQGLLEIDGFCTQAQWEECGHRDGDLARSLGKNGSRRASAVIWRITFGAVLGKNRDAMNDILRRRAGDEKALFTVVLQGIRHESLYLHELTVVQDDPIPHGLVFSNVAL